MGEGLELAFQIGGEKSKDERQLTFAVVDEPDVVEDVDAPDIVEDVPDAVEDASDDDEPDVVCVDVDAGDVDGCVEVVAGAVVGAGAGVVVGAGAGVVVSSSCAITTKSKAAKRIIRCRWGAAGESADNQSSSLSGPLTCDR
jgi:hypothetical protein